MNALTKGCSLQHGKYRIVMTLGQGGFGITYLAEQTMLGRKVAIKEFFMKEFCERDESTSHVTLGTGTIRTTVARFREKFLKEARLIAQMNNRHIVSIYDIFEENGTAYYVMEHLDGGSLSAKLMNGPLSEKLTLQYTYEIADALNYIHAHNILHLDVKPSNILFRNNGESVLIDFGISKRYDDAGGQTSATPVGVSKGYAPMEQYNQGLTKFSPATDIYSLGATMYKMLTGITPPEAMSLLNEIEELERPDGISSFTWNAIEKSMETKVKCRPQSISDFLSLLEESSVESLTIENVTSNDTDEETLLVDTENQNFQEAHYINNYIEFMEFNACGVSFKMARVEGGTFQMGSTDGDNDEKPVHNVILSDYYIGVTEVSQALWSAVMGNNPSNWKGGKLPVEQVSWNDCQEFIKKLNKLTEQKFRLPTEAEWEYAARGGKYSRGYKYSGSDSIDNVAWYKSNCGDKTHEVATKQANELGIYDMSGNVWEWCQDWYGFYTSTVQTNPTGASSGSFRVYRGGGWNCNSSRCRSASRIMYTPTDRAYFLGFRLAL